MISSENVRHCSKSDLSCCVRPFAIIPACVALISRECDLQSRSYHEKATTIVGFKIYVEASYLYQHDNMIVVNTLEPHLLVSLNSMYFEFIDWRNCILS